MQTSILKQNKTKTIPQKTFLAFDIENNPHKDDKTNFLCGCCYGVIRDSRNKEQLIEKTFLTEQALHSFILSLPKKNKSRLAFFNLAYDYLYFRDILKHDKTLTVNGRCISFETINGYKAIDLAKHTQGSLENWIEWAKLETKKIPFEKGEIPRTATPELIKRCQNDTKATYLLANFLQDFYHEQGVSMRLTTGATALALFSKKYFNGDWYRKYVDKNNEIAPQGELEKKAFYGGWTEVYKKGKNNEKIKFWGYDINSAYLSVMQEKFYPIVNQYEYYQEGIKTDYDFNKKCKIYTEWTEKDLKKLNNFYIADILVEAPKTNIPYLPFRTKEKLLFPLGSWRGCYTNIDIKEALKNGYKIKKVYQLIVYTKKTKLFKKYAKRIWDLRRKYKKEKNVGMNKLTKLLGNALYGKFAQRNALVDYLGDHNGFVETLAKMEKSLSYKPVNGVDYTLREHHKDGDINNDDENNLLYSIISDIKIPSRNYFPAISAFITSYCRQKLYKAMIANADRLVYVDTDGIKLSKPAKKGSLIISNELGEWENEGSNEEVILAPKVYGNKKKGVGRNAELLNEDDEKQVWWDYKPYTIKEALQLGNIRYANKWRKYIKTIFKKDEKRIWDIEKGTSKPININDYTEKDIPISL